ncbi:uncharacterized protein DFL_000630 [Arthrobotrys flagrans]|uniref:BTB domain-containing protein n=1 Tax=Arthrobotrys flagrans TaxID=97331 RepID=A0A437AES7_ARTFL|nr:hypothetical protein DFL_000630 [Arthrobotrys flagrans]
MADNAMIPESEAGPSSSSRTRPTSSGQEVELISRMEEMELINHLEQIEILSRIEQIELQLQAVQVTVASLESTRASAPRSLPDSWSLAPLRTPSQSETDTDFTTAEETASDPSTSGLSTPRRLIADTNNSIASPEETGTAITTTTTTFTEDYDLVVIAKDENNQQAFKYQVSKDVLSVSSSVLRPLIRAIPAPSDNSGTAATTRRFRELDLDGDPEALRVIFGIIHFNADESSRDISFNTLYKIAILAEKYQWQGALQTWSEIWLLLWERFALDPGYENWLYISKVFNTQREVENLVALLAKQCSSIGVEGVQAYRLCDARKEYLNTELWPEELQNQIMRLRQERVRHLCSSFGLLYRALACAACSEYLEALEPNRPLCESEICCDLAYGSLLRSIYQTDRLISLSPRLIREWYKSAAELENELRKLKFNTLEVVVPGHRCVLQDIKSGFASCIGEHDPALESEARMRRIFGSIVVYKRDRVRLTDGLAGSSSTD